MTTTSTTGITASGGVTLAVHRYTDIDPQRPTILAIHGWPDPSMIRLFARLDIRQT